MDLIILGDRDELHRKGIKLFLSAIYERLRFVETPLFNAWCRHCSTAASEITREDASLETVARDLAGALRVTLQAQEEAEARCTALEKQLATARDGEAYYRSCWKTLHTATDTKQLHAWQDQVRVLEQQLSQARTACSILETRLTEQQRCLAAREATIAELNCLIARQVTEFDALFGVAEDSGGAA